MDQAQLSKILRLAKRYLLPQVRKWWKQRQAAKHNQQVPQGQQQQQQSSYAHPPQQQQQQQQGYYGQQQQQGGYYGQAPPPQQQGQYGGYDQAPQQQQHHQQYQQQQPHHQQQQYGAAGYGGAQQYHPPQGRNDDQVNASNPHYVGLRNAAIAEGQAMHQAFDAASRAHDAGDGAQAKQLSNEGHEHQRKKEQLNDEAADWIYNANNSDKGPGEVDLHGLYVQEAIERTERAVKVAQSQNLPELRIITGKGIHSNQHIAKIKPAIENMMVKYNLSAHLDPHNTGVLVVNLAGGGGGASRDLGWVDQADRESANGECTIM